MMNLGRRSIKSVLIVVLCLCSIFFLSPGTAEALGFFTPFGGRVFFTTTCTCSGSLLIQVGPPRGGSFIVASYSRVHRNYMPTTGRWVLGIAAGEATCMVLIFTPYPTCVPRGAGSVVIRMGTS